MTLEQAWKEGALGGDHHLRHRVMDLVEHLRSLDVAVDAAGGAR